MEMAHGPRPATPSPHPAVLGGGALGPLRLDVTAADPRLGARLAPFLGGLPAAGVRPSQGLGVHLELDLLRAPALAPPPRPDASWDVWGRTPAWDADVVVGPGSVAARFSFDAAFMGALAAKEVVAIDTLLRAAVRMTLAVAAPVATGLLVHGAALIRPDDGEAFVFVGPSGAGKTTITGRLPGFSIIADDTLLLWDDGDRLRVSGTPLRGREGHPAVVAAAPVKALVRITPGVAPRSFHRLAASDALAELLQRTFFYPSARVADTLRGRLLEVSARFAERLPAFALGSTLAHDLADLFQPGGPADV